VTNRNTGKPMFIKSDKAQDYEDNFLKQITGLHRLGLGGEGDPILVWARIWYRSNQPDVSSELILDLLQKADVLTNDRWAKGQMLFGAVDVENPRTEFRFYRLRE